MIANKRTCNSTNGRRCGSPVTFSDLSAKQSTRNSTYSSTNTKIT